MSRLGQMLPNRLWPCQFGPFSATGGTFTQAGTGGPSPTNIRAISPWLASGATVPVKRTGKNLFNESAVIGVSNGSSTNITYSSYRRLSDGTIVNTLTLYGNSSFLRGADVLLPPGTYKLSADLYLDSDTYTLKKIWLCAYSLNLSTNVGTSIAGGEQILSSLKAWERKSVSFTLSVPTWITPSIQAEGSASFLSVPTWCKNIQLELGSVATPYEPYISKPCTLPAPAEMYAGYQGDDWWWRRTALGILFNGSTETWSDTNFAASGYFETTLASAAHATPGLACSKFLPATTAAADSNKVIISGTSLKIYPADAVATNLAGWLAWLAANTARIVYTLATPVLFAPILP